MLENPNELISLVDTRGGVKWVRKWEVEDCIAKGWRKITNPKENYYPQYDQSITGVNVPPGNIVENLEIGDVLELEEV